MFFEKSKKNYREGMFVLCKKKRKYEKRLKKRKNTGEISKDEYTIK